MAREVMTMSFMGREREKERKRCTDLGCLCFFILCLLGLVAVAVFGFKYGSPATLERLVRGRDFDGRLCGKDVAVKDFPLAYFTLEDKTARPYQWTAGLRSQLKIVCTNTCPSSDPAISSTVPRNPGVCPDDMYPNWCTWYGDATVRFANYCIDPDVFDVFNIASSWEQSLENLHAAVFHLLAIFPVSIIIGLIYLTTMEKCSGFFVWCAIILVILLPAGIGLWLYHDATTEGQVQDLTSINQDQEKWIAYGCWIFSGIIVLVAVCSLKTIRGVASVVSGTSQFLKDVPSQFLQPLMFGLLHVVVMSAWLVILFFVMSIGAKEGDTQKCLADSDFLCVEWNRGNQSISLIFLLVMIYWMLNFLNACSYFGTAFAVREWYFTKPDESGAKRPGIGGRCLCDCKLSIIGVCKGLAHHSGSFAFGSLCISICKVIRLLLFWVTKDENAVSSNPVFKCVLKCANCIAACIERFVQFISEHAYIEMAIRGNGFCLSAKEAMKMAVDKPVLFTLVGSVACMVKVLGVALITIVGTCVVRLSLGWWRPDGIESFTAPVVVAAVFCFFFGEIMMHPFAAAARACMHCYILDAEQSDSADSEYTPQPLKRFVETHDRDELEGRSRGCCC